MASLTWDPYMWRWIDGGQFLNYTTKDGREAIINRIPCTTRGADKWQGYLSGSSLPLIFCIHVRSGPIYWGVIYIAKNIIR